MATLTGSAGGVMRDIFINEEPLFFRKEIYAMACVIGALVYCLCDRMGCDVLVAQIVCGISVFVVRTLAVKYNICLPVLTGAEEENKEN